MTIDTRPEVIPGGTFGPLDDLEPTEHEMTEWARAETEGATERRELAEGKCQATWRNYPHENIWPDDPTVYRQHRCGRESTHRGACRCRYCGRDRASA